jgi:hypothetical protein
MIVSRRLGQSQPSIALDVYGYMIPLIHKEMADMMDEITNPINVDINDWKHNIATSIPHLHQVAPRFSLTVGESIRLIS